MFCKREILQVLIIIQQNDKSTQEYLNSRCVRLNCSFPLVRDAIQILGASECELISVIDLRDAYHSLRLTTESQKYCGITPYYGSDTYLYQRFGMGLSVSPAIWQTLSTKYLMKSLIENTL